MNEQTKRDIAIEYLGAHREGIAFALAHEDTGFSVAGAATYVDKVRRILLAESVADPDAGYIAPEPLDSSFDTLHRAVHDHFDDGNPGIVDSWVLIVETAHNSRSGIWVTSSFGVTPAHAIGVISEGAFKIRSGDFR